MEKKNYRPSGRDNLEDGLCTASEDGDKNSSFPLSHTVLVWLRKAPGGIQQLHLRFYPAEFQLG
jgi:hypothetical protein